MKKFLALVLALVMTMSLVTVSASAKTDFTDDAKINNEEAVEVLNAMGVLTGYADGSFRPQGTLTRGAGAKIIAYLMLGQAKADKLAATYTVFKDVDDSVGLAAYIEWAAANGIVDGYGDGNFGPYNTLTEYAFGKMLLTALGYNSEKEGYVGAGWQKNVYRDAAANGVFDGTESWGACDRETAARMALGALLAEIVAYGKVSNFWYSSDLKDNEPSAKSINIFDKVGVITVEGAVETGVALWENYKDLTYYADEHDIFARPGHGWTYGKNFSKFYMDAPVAEYTTATTVCNILVDLGIAKTSKARAFLNFYYNGVKCNSVNDYYDHSECADVWGNQGTLTQVFELADGTYCVTEIDTYLAVVDSAKDNTHKKAGTSVIDVYSVADNSVNAKAQGHCDSDLSLKGNIGYAKYDYILVNLSKGTGWVIDDTYEAEENQYGYAYAVVVGEPTVISAAKFTGVAADKSQATVAGKREDVAYQYSMSASGLDFENAGESYDFFVDQYGNIIGDANPAGAAYTYGVLADLIWVNDGGIRGDHYAEVLYYGADAQDSVFTMKSYDGKKVADADTKDGNSSETPVLVSQKASNNADFYDADRFLGVVKNYGDGKIAPVSKETKAEYAVSASFEKTNPNIGGMTAKVDNDTVFLVKTLKGTTAVYTSYEGIDNLPTIKLAAAVAVTEPYDTTATFVYIDATNAIFDGSSVLAVVLNNTYKYADVLSGTYEYEVYVNGEKTTVIATTDNLGDNADALFAADGLYELNMNADGKVIKATALYSTSGWMTTYTASDVTDEDTVVVLNGGNAYNIANAKIYAIHYPDTASAGWAASTSVEVMDKADIDAEELVVYKLAANSSYVIDTLFVFVADET